MKTLIALTTAALLFAPALMPAPARAQAIEVVLKANVTDGDGRITLGDLFDNAGVAADVVVGTRPGPTAVLDAAQVQGIAARAGVIWANPRGLRRIIVTAGADSAPATTQTRFQPAVSLGRPAASTIVVRRQEAVSVTWSQHGLSLTVSGTAQRDAAVGDQIQVQNPTSKKLIDAVITGPGQAVAGEAAEHFRQNMLLSSR